MIINSYEDFKEQLKEVCLAKHGINVLSLQKQMDENLSLLENVSATDKACCHNILVKNMKELYQDFLINNTPPSIYLSRLADEYKYLLDYYSFEAFRDTCKNALIKRELKYTEQSHDVFAILLEDEKVLPMNVRRIFIQNDIANHPEKTKEAIEYFFLESVSTQLLQNEAERIEER